MIDTKGQARGVVGLHVPVVALEAVKIACRPGDSQEMTSERFIVGSWS